jgi:hypothetical protein
MPPDHALAPPALIGETDQGTIEGRRIPEAARASSNRQRDVIDR